MSRPTAKIPVSLAEIKAKHGLEINRVKFNQGSQALVPGDIIQVASSRFVFDRKTTGR